MMTWSRDCVCWQAGDRTPDDWAAWGVSPWSAAGEVPAAVRDGAGHGGLGEGASGRRKEVKGRGDWAEGVGRQWMVPVASRYALYAICHGCQCVPIGMERVYCVMDIPWHTVLGAVVPLSRVYNACNVYNVCHVDGEQCRGAACDRAFADPPGLAV